MESVESKIKQKLVERLELEIAPEDIDDNAALFRPDGVGLDSVDALEVVAMFRVEFNVDITDAAVAREVLNSIHTIAEYVRKHG
jgi:acyl carrier protein